MNHEDLVTIKAFLLALESLDQSLPKKLQTELRTITEALPNSAYELIDPASIKIAKAQLEENTDESVAAESRDISVEAVKQELVSMQPIKATPVKNFIRDLGWTEEQIFRARYAFTSFQEDWDDPAMEVYDDL